MLNTIPVTPKKIPEILDWCHDKKLSVILWGSTGIGKTEMVNQWVAALPNKEAFRGRKAKMFGAHLATIEAVDVKGMTIPDLASKKTVYLPPEFLPDDNDDGVGAIFWDEINRGEPRIQNAVFQLLQERRCGNRRIPDGYLIVAAANEAELSSSVHMMDPALADRLIHLHVVADAESWCDWGVKSGRIDPKVLAFIRSQPQWLDKCEERVRNGSIVGASPRGWERVSMVVRDAEKLPYETMAVLVNGIVGKEAAAAFFEVYEDLSNPLPLDKMMTADPEKLIELLPRNQIGFYRLAYALVGVVKDGQTALRALEIINAWRHLADKHPEIPLAELQTFAAEMMFEKAFAVKANDALVGSAAYEEYMANRPTHGKH